MRVHSIKTDNASVADKVALRRKATAELFTLRVLDLYAGENILWSHFNIERYYGVDIVPGKGKNLHGDCKRVISSLDLGGFNIIDCDSYGIPFDVILRIFENETLRKGTIVIYTAISNKMSAVSKECLKMFNLGHMRRKSSTLLAAKALDLFYAMLERQGVGMVHYSKIKGSFEKHYGYFRV